MVALLRGLDALAFCAGVGENDVQLRADIGEQLDWLGVRIDPYLNKSATDGEIHAIHAPDSSVEVWVIPTDEGIVVAQEAWDLAHPR